MQPILALACCLLALPLVAEDVRYPAETVVDLSQAPYNLDPTGVADCTAGLQQALDDHVIDITTRRILYLPNGTYRLSDRVVLDTHDTNDGGSGRGIILQGQSQDGVVLRLDDQASGFSDGASPRAVVDFNEGNDLGGWQFVAFNTFIANLTIDIGSGNPGAIGLDFCANNAGGLRDVTLRSSDPAHAGHTGLLLSTLPGPQFIKRLTVDGFEWGIRTESFPNYATTIEHLTVRNCRSGGIANARHSLVLRAVSASDLGGPLLVNSHADGLVCLLEASLSGGPGGSAIVDDGFLYLRAIDAGSGYERVLTSHGVPIDGSSLAEWVTGGGVSLYADAPTGMLGLPIVEPPEPIWDDPANWVSIADYGANPGDYSDDSAAIQRAIDAMVASSGPDAGKATLYFPVTTSSAGKSRYDIDHPITIPAGIRRIVGCYALLHPRNAVVTDQPMFILSGGGEPLVIEQLFTGADSAANPTPIVANQSSRDVYLRDIHMLEGKAYDGTAATGRLFLDNVAATSLRYWVGDPQPVASAIPQFDFAAQSVWARQLNPEQKDLTIRNAGGRLWILGIKNEEDGTLVATSAGGRSEIIGGILMPLDVDVGSDPAFTVIDGELSVVIAGHIRSRHPTPLADHAPINEILIRESVGVDVRAIADGDAVFRRSYSNDQGDTPPMIMGFRSRGLRSITLSVGDADGIVTGVEIDHVESGRSGSNGPVTVDGLGVDADQTFRLGTAASASG